MVGPPQHESRAVSQELWWREWSVELVGEKGTFVARSVGGNQNALFHFLEQRSDERKKEEKENHSEVERKGKGA